MPTLFRNGIIRTMDRKGSVFDALAVEGDLVRAVGPASELEPLLDQGYEAVDLDGACVAPGFIDCHAHMLMTGVMGISCDLAGATSLDETFQRLSDWWQAHGRDNGGRPAALGFRFDDQAATEARMPLRHELDRVFPGVPALVMHATCHRCSVNTKGLDFFRLPLDLPGLDLEGGEPTGVVRDPGILTHVFPALFGDVDMGTAARALEHAARQALAAGVTTVHSLEGGDFTPGGTEKLLAVARDLPVRTVAWNQSVNVDQAVALGLPRAGGCICADGELDARTAALFEPYADQPGNYGDLYYSQENMNRFVWAAHSRGMQIAVHCEAERSIEQVLCAVEKAQERLPRPDARHRIEHFELPTPGQIERMARTRTIASVQPGFIPAFIQGANLERMKAMFGPVRYRLLHPYRTMRDAGVTLCGGSDSPVTPFNPLAGVAAMAGHAFDEQSLSVDEALAVFTRNAAYSAFEENEKGSLRPGKLADFVVLSEDPCTVPPESVGSVRVRQVFVGGRQAA